MPVLYNPADGSNVLVLEELQAAAPILGLTLQSIGVQNSGGFAEAFATMARGGAHAFFGTPGILTFEHRSSVVDLAAKALDLTLPPRLLARADEVIE